MRYRFSDADRERLGITDEWVEFDIARLMFDEAMGLEEAGYDVNEFLNDYRGRPVYEDGKPVMIDITDDDGDPVIEGGRPKQVQARRVPLRAMGAAMWITARRGGSKVSFSEFTFDMAGLQSGDDAPEGKGDSPDAGSNDPASDS